ncbi:MAG: acetyltransferase [Burkholderiales bacterium]|nr:acetyltransferase [Burkholderiales bacterium]
MSAARRRKAPTARTGSRACIVVGAGGHAKVLVDCLRAAGVRVLGFVDRDPRRHGATVCGLPVLGGDAALAGRKARAAWLVNGVGGTGFTVRRKAVFESLRNNGHRFLTVVHPSAVLAAGARLGAGAQVMAGAVIQADAVVGDNAIVNTGARVDHDCSIGAHAHIAPGCVLSGGVRVGEETHLGTAAVVIEGVRIGKRCLVAAGAVVVRDVPDGARVMGVPARPARRR